MADEVGAEVWIGERAARWLRQAEHLERQLVPVSEVLFEAAALQPGEAVLDVGCGTGPTTIVAARAVGPAGRVVGLDLAGDLLAAAATAAGDLPNVEWLEVDAVDWDPPPAGFDVVLSRFGVMFFGDPPTAFANLAEATRPGGRLVAATWQRRDESELFAVPVHAAIGAVRAFGARTEAELEALVAADDAGPFSLHGPDVVVGLLERAGWRDVEVTPHRLTLPYGGGGVTGADLAPFATDFGPVRTLLEGLDDEVAAAAGAAILEALAERTDADGVPQLSGAVNVVTARR